MSRPLAVDGAPSGDRPVVEVAVGVLLDAEGRVLLTSRPPGKVYAGHWEFPGGKFEPGEDLEAALRRELREELGILIGPPEPWRELQVDYPHARVRLQVAKVRSWTGTLTMCEGQSMHWSALPATLVPLLPGAVPLLAWLAEDDAGRR